MRGHRIQLLDIHPPSLLDEFCSPPAIASLLGVSTTKVYSAIRDNTDGLSHVRTPGKQFKVRRRDLLAYCHKQGITVPEGLVPMRPPVVVLHPDVVISSRVRMILEPRCHVVVFDDPLEGLLGLGGKRPPLVIVSRLCGAYFVKRLCDAVAGQIGIGYMAILLLADDGSDPWSGGPIPLPLKHPEPHDADDSSLGLVVDAILGLR